MRTFDGPHAFRRGAREPRPIARWVSVSDDEGRRRLEMRWAVPDRDTARVGEAARDTITLETNSSNPFISDNAGAATAGDGFSVDPSVGVGDANEVDANLFRVPVDHLR
ncbi:MAG TPA: hypothetical protein VHN80_21590 [Kineosporiaceae bacterium]|nr:hypothetical protein [Kineosporiaceae bacterium]